MLIAFAGRQQRQRRRPQASACSLKPHMEGPERGAAACSAADIAQLPELALELIFSALDVRCSPCMLLWPSLCITHLEQQGLLYGSFGCIKLLSFAVHVTVLC